MQSSPTYSLSSWLTSLLPAALADEAKSEEQAVNEEGAGESDNTSKGKEVASKDDEKAENDESTEPGDDGNQGEAEEEEEEEEPEDVSDAICKGLRNFLLKPTAGVPCYSRECVDFTVFYAAALNKT